MARRNSDEFAQLIFASRPGGLGWRRKQRGRSVVAVRIGAAAVLIFALASQQVYAQSAPAGDPAKGKLVFLECQGCHAVASGGPVLVGPDLAGVVGRKAGSLPGYNYSPALKASGLVWDDANLDRWLTDPSTLVPGTKMAFAGIDSPALRADVIAYLATLK
jgi:cytochrome c2